MNEWMKLMKWIKCMNEWNVYMNEMNEWNIYLNEMNGKMNEISEKN